MHLLAIPKYLRYSAWASKASVVGESLVHAQPLQRPHALRGTRNQLLAHARERAYTAEGAYIWTESNAGANLSELGSLLIELDVNV